MMGGIARRYPLGTFLVVTYAWSWSYWIADALSGGHWSHFPGLLGPLVGATVVTGLTGSFHHLWVKMTRWRVPLRWYGLALIPAIPAAVVYVTWWLASSEGPTWTEVIHMKGTPAF